MLSLFFLDTTGWCKDTRKWWQMDSIVRTYRTVMLKELEPAVMGKVTVMLQLESELPD